jgi:hypothetical protein
MVKGFEGTLECIQHDYDRMTFIPSADYLVVEGTSQGRMSGKPWAGDKLLAAVSATSSSFEMAEYRACTSILIPTIRARMRRGFDGIRTVSGETMPSKVRHLNSRTEPCRAQFQLAWSRSTLFHQRGSAISDFLEHHFQATKLLRA